MQGLRLSDVNALLPRFSYSTQLSLKGLWQALGARQVFEPAQADLTPALNMPGAFVSDVLHEANIEVDEIGTTAAAASLVAVEPFGEPPQRQQPQPHVINFIANRPFLWMLRHHSTDLILFMGRHAGD